MKILHINRHYLTSPLHQTMQEHLDAFPVESVVFAPVGREETPAISPRGNVIVARCFSRRDRAFYFLKQARIRAAYASACRDMRFDCAHAYTVFTDGNFAMRLFRKTGMPYIVSVRGTDVFTFFCRFAPLRPLGVRILRNASAVSFLSDSARQIVFEKYIPKKYHREIAEKTYVIPNGIHDFWLENLRPGSNEDALRRIARRELRLIYAGRINRNKNLPTLLAAMEILRSRGWQAELTIAGPADDPAEYQKIVSAPHVTIVPAQPRESLIHLYRAADIFVMVSHTETFGLVYAEAMSQGLPVVYTRGQGFDGQFPEGEAGYSASDRSPQDVADAIEKTAENYAAIQPRCADLARRFCWKDICAVYARLYAEAALQK